LAELVILKSLTESKKKGEQIDKLMESFNQVFYYMIFFSVLMAFAIVYNMFTLNVNERLRDYATMKTLGTTTTRVGKLLVNELSLVIVFGIILGTLLALGLTKLMLANVSEAFEGFEFEMVFSWKGFLYGVGIILFSVISVFLIAIRRIMKMNLADMIRIRSE
jgi:putative ABC transport system permease protein